MIKQSRKLSLAFALMAGACATAANDEKSLPESCNGKVADLAITDFIIEERLPNPGTVAVFKWIVFYTNNGPNASGGLYHYRLFDAADNREVASRWRNAAVSIGEQRSRISNESAIIIRPGNFYYAKIEYSCDPNLANNQSAAVIVERAPHIFKNSFESPSTSNAVVASAQKNGVEILETALPNGEYEYTIKPSMPRLRK